VQLTLPLCPLGPVGGAEAELVAMAGARTAREPATLSPDQADGHAHGWGRELFAGMRRQVGSAEEGACTWL
jgi:phosphogluconate dehydratase